MILDKIRFEYPEVVEIITKAETEALFHGIQDAYTICNICIGELEKIGWTAEISISGELYDLQKLK